MEEASALAAVLSESADVAAVSEGTESGEVSYTESGKYCGSSSARVTPPSTSSAIEEAICCACESALAFRVVRCAAAKRRRQTVLMIKKKKITIRNSMKNRREPVRAFFFMKSQAERTRRGAASFQKEWKTGIKRVKYIKADIHRKSQECTCLAITNISIVSKQSNSKRDCRSYSAPARSMYDDGLCGTCMIRG